jgi:hypothetical protein
MINGESFRGVHLDDHKSVCKYISKIFTDNDFVVSDFDVILRFSGDAHSF